MNTSIKPRIQAKQSKITTSNTNTKHLLQTVNDEDLQMNLTGIAAMNLAIAAMFVGAPSRPLDEFEQLIYEYTLRMGLEDESPEGNEHWGIDAKSCNLRFESASKGPYSPQASYLLTIPPNLCNYMGNLHGGCAATLIDILSTTILLGMSRPGVFALGGVSRNLKTTYLRPVPQGTEIRLKCYLMHAGRRLAYLRAEISRTDNGDLCVLGEHEKANTDPEVGEKL